MDNVINLNELYSGDRWHAISNDNKDCLFCEKDGLFVQYMNTLAFPKEYFENGIAGVSFRFISKLERYITWDDYLENYHNKELAKFKSLGLERMCEKLRKLYVDCEEDIKDFNKDKIYSEFRKILNTSIGIRHGKGERPATKMDCIKAFKEYQSFNK